MVQRSALFISKLSRISFFPLFVFSSFFLFVSLTFISTFPGENTHSVLVFERHRMIPSEAKTATVALSVLHERCATAFVCKRVNTATATKYCSTLIFRSSLRISLSSKLNTAHCFESLVSTMWISRGFVCLFVPEIVAIYFRYGWYDRSEIASPFLLNSRWYRIALFTPFAYRLASQRTVNDDG